MDSGASNHMMNHEEWFSYLEKPEQSGVVETGDKTPHPIEHIGDIMLSHFGQKGIMRNVLHIPTITTNLVSVRQIVDSGMQVRFTHLRCIIEEEGKIIMQRHREGRMFILEMNDVNTVMFAKRAEGRIRHRLVAQAVRSCQLPTASRNADEEHCFRIAEI